MSEQNNPTAGLTNLLEDFVNDYQVKPQAAPKRAPQGQPEKTVASVMAKKEKPGLHPLLEKICRMRKTLGFRYFHQRELPALIQNQRRADPRSAQTAHSARHRSFGVFHHER